MLVRFFPLSMFAIHAFCTVAALALSIVFRGKLQAAVVLPIIALAVPRRGPVRRHAVMAP